jgi:hypothetical protein
MPTFYTRKPSGIAAGVRALLNSSPRLTEADIRALDDRAAGSEYKSALAEKARLEVEQAMRSDRLRSDPNVASEYASVASGITAPEGRRLSGYIRGETIAPSTTVDDEGNANAPASYARPDVSPGQERAFRSTLASAMANQLATGKTNAEQLTHAGGNLLTQAVRSAMAEAPDISEENRLGHSIGAQAREPFSRGPNAQGLMVNQESGDIYSEPTLHAAAVAAANKKAEGTNAKPPRGYAWGPENANGEPTLVPIEGGPAGLGKALPHSSVKDLSVAGTAVEDTQRLAKSFQPEYGGKTLLGDLSNTYKRVVGDKTGQAQWWQDMDALQNQTRHTLFGSALTKTELAAWEKTSITPRMNPDQIQQNLQRRQEIEARAASKLARGYEAAGYNKDQIRELLGVAAQYIEGAAPPTSPVSRGASGGWNGVDRRAPSGRVVVDF